MKNIKKNKETNDDLSVKTILFLRNTKKSTQ